MPPPGFMDDEVARLVEEFEKSQGAIWEVVIIEVFGTEAPYFVEGTLSPCPPTQLKLDCVCAFSLVLSKPIVGELFKSLIRRLGSFWLDSWRKVRCLLVCKTYLLIQKDCIAALVT